MKKNFLKLTAFLLALTGVQNVHAISIDWSGGYRIEYTEVDRPSLSEPGNKKAYGLQYLYIQPRIIASDGINIVSRFDILGSDIAAYRNSQLGSFIGSTLSANAGANASSQTSESSNMRVSQLYLNVNHEYGSLVAGRAPLEFGMGITHSAGRGAFDHWVDTKDMVGYKVLVDNISLMPILARIQQKDYEIARTINEQIFVFEYDNKDIGAKAGAIHQTRRGSVPTNDMTTNATNAIPGGTVVSGGFNTQTINVFLERRWSAFEFKIEASFLTGQTGLQTAAGEDINFNSYAVASELLFPAKDSSWEFGAKLGLVSGDNPDTVNYEGYQLDRNYDVGILLFNHRMGNGTDFFTTGILHANDTANGLTTSNSADDEAIGNAMYLAPSAKYIWNERFDLKTTLIYAQLLNPPTANLVDFKKDLGLELDIELIYKPRERVTWSTGVGLLSPGSAWKLGNTGADNKFNYGFTTKAAITF